MRTARRAVLVLVAALAGAGAAPPAVSSGPGEIEVEGARVRIAAPWDAFALGAPGLLAWVRGSAHAVAGYYGTFPVRELTLTLEAHAGGGVHGGKTFGYPAARIRVGVGREVSAAELADDWVLVHEMTHLALPDTGEEHAWLSEGIATYVEGIARVQAGRRTESDVWAEELRAMPRGMPEAGDAGLDRTHTWGRTYWGGAMFCLIADVTIHQRTGNRVGLQDALRAVLAASGGLKADWPIERVLTTGDAAVGVPVLEELYATYARAPNAPDLERLWRELGVERTNDGVRLDDAAPLAAVRRAIMRPRAEAARP